MSASETDLLRNISMNLYENHMTAYELVSRRRMSKLTQKDVAEALGVSQQVISYFENKICDGVDSVSYKYVMFYTVMAEKGII